MEALVTVAIPSYNQGEFLQSNLDSIFEQGVPLEICIADGGSTDGSKQIIEKNTERLKWYQSKPDGGQSQAVNLAVQNGTAPYICWLNSDDLLMPNILDEMVAILEQNPSVPAIYGRASYIDHDGKIIGEYFTQVFSKENLSIRCIVCQPAVLIRRTVWEQLEGLDESLNMSMDYDLWWRIYRTFGEMKYVQSIFAMSRIHGNTKTNSFRKLHYQESIQIVRNYSKSYVWFWYLKWPWSVWYKSWINKFKYSK
jgi:GT2 family glycosyltransferase